MTLDQVKDCTVSGDYRTVFYCASSIHTGNLIREVYSGVVVRFDEARGYGTPMLNMITIEGLDLWFYMKDIEEIV